MENDISDDDISSEFKEYYEHRSKSEKHLNIMIAFNLDGTYEVLA